MGKGDLIDEKYELPKSEEAKPAQWKSAVSVVAVLIMAYFIIRWFIRLLIPVLAVILLVANRDIVVKIIRKIYALYKDETYKGLLATLGAVVLFLPFMVFLFCRSAYYMVMKDQKKESDEKEKDDLSSSLITIAVKEKVKDILGVDEDEKNK